MNLFYTQDKPNPIWWIAGKPNKYFADVSKTFMGRDALNILLTNTSAKRVLIPAYNCNEVILEFEKKNCEIFYYDIKPDFTIDADKILEQIKRHNIELFYHIIYFGFEHLNNILNLKLKAACPQVIIIEDRAHYLSNQFNFSVCDAYLFSFRKLLPIAEGGGFISKHQYKFETSKPIQANILPVLMYLKKKILGYNDNFNRTALTKNQKRERIMPMSYLSQRLVKRYDFEKEIEFRRQCFNLWILKLKMTSIRPVFQELAEADVPQGCPIFVDDANRVQAFMKNCNYYLRRHWKLKKELETQAPESYSISKRIITLPIYKGITEKIQDKVISNLIKYNEYSDL